MASKDQTSKNSQPAVSDDFSRRHLLKSIGTAGIAALVPEVAATENSPLSHAIPATSRATNKSDLVRLSSGRIVAMFDRQNGTLYSITEAQDALGTNFLGNSDNTSGVQNRDTHWTGDVVTTIWKLKTPEWIREQESFVPYYVSGKWEPESTLASQDIRKVGFDGKAFAVKYSGRSQG